MNALTAKSVRDAFASHGIYHRLARSSSRRVLVTSAAAPALSFESADHLAEAVCAYLAEFNNSTSDQGSTK